MFKSNYEVSGYITIILTFDFLYFDVVSNSCFASIFLFVCLCVCVSVLLCNLQGAIKQMKFIELYLVRLVPCVCTIQKGRQWCTTISLVVSVVDNDYMKCLSNAEKSSLLLHVIVDTTFAQKTQRKFRLFIQLYLHNPVIHIISIQRNVRDRFVYYWYERFVMIMTQFVLFCIRGTSYFSFPRFPHMQMCIQRRDIIGETIKFNSEKYF